MGIYARGRIETAWRHHVRRGEGDWRVVGTRAPLHRVSGHLHGRVPVPSRPGPRRRRDLGPAPRATWLLGRGSRQGHHPARGYLRRILSIALPLASSSMSLSR